MSRYGIDYYGVGFYGLDNPILFDANPFTAVPFDYGKLNLEWTKPTGAWSRIRLVRNRYGYPVNAWDGDVLYEAINGLDAIAYQDNGPLLPAQFYYYSIFVFELTQYTWARAADTYGLSVKDYGNSSRLFKYLPEVYKVESIFSADTRLNNQDLYNFLALFGFQINYMQTLTDLLIQRYNIEKVGGTLVPTMLKQFGWNYETEVGLQQSRIILRDAIQLYKDKGSSQGLREIVKSFSNYAVTSPVEGTPNPTIDGLQVSHNLMLDYNDSSFEESVGHWASVSNATLRQLKRKNITNVALTTNVATLTVGAHNYSVGNKIYVLDCEFPIFLSPSTPKTITAVTSTTISYALTGTNVSSRKAGGYILPAPEPYEESTSPANYPNRRSGILSVTNSSASAGTVSFDCGSSNSVTKGVPVKPSNPYTFSIYSTAGSTGRQVTLSIKWYNRFGVILSTSSNTASANTTTDWATRFSVTATAPALAAYAVPQISIASVAGSATPEYHYFDAAQFEQSPNATEFDEARQIYITPRATRINELKNPHFKAPIAPWAITGGTSSVDIDASEPGLRTYTVTNSVLTSNVATITTSRFHELRVGRLVIVKNVGAPYDGTFTITAVTPNTFSYSRVNANIPSAPATGDAYHAGDSLKIIATTSDVTVESAATSADYMPIHYPSSQYTFSLYGKVDLDTEPIRLFISWYTSTNTLIETDTGQIEYLTTEWTRPFLTVEAPSNAAYAKVGLTWSVIGGNTVTLDSSLFERTPFLLEYFDGNDGPAETQDLFWEGGVPGAGRSHLYKNRVPVQTRLDDVLDDFLPLGSTFAVFLAQSKT